MKTMDMITFVIAVASFLMSLSSWVYSIITNRKNISIVIRDIKTYNNTTILNMSFENKSQLPISITRIAMVVHGSKTDCTVTDVPMIEINKKNGDGSIYGYDELRCLPIPIHLSELGSAGGFILFENVPDLPEPSSTHLTLLIATNRGRAIEKQFPLPQDWASRRKTISLGTTQIDIQED